MNKYVSWGYLNASLYILVINMINLYYYYSGQSLNPDEAIWTIKFLCMVGFKWQVLKSGIEQVLGHCNGVSEYFKGDAWYTF